MRKNGKKRRWRRIWLSRDRWNEHYSIGNSSDATWICWKLQGFPIRKESRIKDTSIWQKKFWKVLVQAFSNRLCVTHNKNLEQRKFRTKGRINNISLFKSNSERYGNQLRQLTVSIPSSIFLDISWIYGCQLRQLKESIGSSILDSSESYFVNSDSWWEA